MSQLLKLWHTKYNVQCSSLGHFRATWKKRVWTQLKASTEWFKSNYSSSWWLFAHIFSTVFEKKVHDTMVYRRWIRVVKIKPDNGSIQWKKWPLDQKPLEYLSHTSIGLFGWIDSVLFSSPVFSSQSCFLFNLKLHLIHILSLDSTYQYHSISGTTYFKWNILSNLRSLDDNSHVPCKTSTWQIWRFRMMPGDAVGGSRKKKSIQANGGC